MEKVESDYSRHPSYINCFTCVHFHVTWDQRFPKGCRAMNFKTSRLPSHEVYLASGMRCEFFEEKPLSLQSREKQVN